MVLIYNESLKENIKIIIEKIKNLNSLKQGYSEIIIRLNRIFAMIINNMKYFKNIYFESIMNYIKSKIDNYFKFSISNGSFIHLLKVKILKNLIDKGENFDSYDLLLDKVKSIPPPHLNYIPISLCTDNNFTKLAYVTFT